MSARALLVGAVCAVAASSAVALASFGGLGDDPARSIYRPDVPSPLAAPATVPRGGFEADRRAVAQIVADQARAQGIDPALALRIAHVETRFRNLAGPRLREGDRALGVMQVRPSSARALGFRGDARELLDPRVGAYWGVRHMAECARVGAQTDDQHAACHVAGPKGWRARLRAKAEAYKRRYVAMVRAAPVARVDSGGWLARGPGSLNVAMLFR